MPIELTMSLENVKNRLAQTRAVQNAIGLTWVWEGSTLAAWDEMLRHFDPQSTAPNASLASVVKDENVAYNNDRQALDGALSAIALTTSCALSGLRGRARSDENLADEVAGLSSHADSRSGIEENAKNLLIVWEDYNQDWTPGSPHNFGSLSIMLAALPALDKTYRLTRSSLRKAEKALRRHAQLTEDTCMAWYVAATGFWPAGTTEGDLIRGQVPVSSSLHVTLAPAKPGATTALAIGNGRVVGDCADAAGATKYRWYTKGPGDVTFVFRMETATSEALLLNLTPGPHDLRVTGTNSGGESVPSDIAPVIVT